MTTCVYMCIVLRYVSLHVCLQIYYNTNRYMYKYSIAYNSTYGKPDDVNGNGWNHDGLVLIWAFRRLKLFEINVPSARNCASFRGPSMWVNASNSVASVSNCVISGYVRSISFLRSVYRGHSSMKCFSSSTELRLQNLHSRCSGGILGLVYLPVSIARLWVLVLSFSQLI